MVYSEISVANFFVLGQPYRLPAQRCGCCILFAAAEKGERRAGIAAGNCPRGTVCNNAKKRTEATAQKSAENAPEKFKNKNPPDPYGSSGNLAERKGFEPLNGY